MTQNDDGDADHAVVGRSKNGDTFAQIWDDITADAIENLNWRVFTSVIDAVDSVMLRLTTETGPVDPDFEQDVREMADDAIGRILMRAEQEFEMMRMIHSIANGSFGQTKLDLDQRLFRLG